MRLRGGIFGEQLHGANVGQIQRLVFGLQPKGSTQKRLQDNADSARSAFHEAPTQRKRGPAGKVPFYNGNEKDTKGTAFKTQPQYKLSQVHKGLYVLLALQTP